MSKNRARPSRVTAFQLFAIIVRGVIGVGILGLARVVTEEAKQDGWISILGAGAVLAVGMVAFTALCNRYPHKTILEIVEHILGKWIGKCMGILFTGSFVFGSALLVRYFAEVMATWFLHETPFWVIMLTAMMMVVYISHKGMSCLIRFNELIFMILLPTILVFFIGMPYVRMFNIMPIGGAGAGAMIKSIRPALFALGGYEVLFFLNPYIDSRKNVGKACVGAVAFITFFYSAIVFLQIGFFGHEELQFLIFTVMKYLRSFEIGVFGRLDLLFIFVWSFVIISTLSIHYFLVGFTIGETFTIPDQKRKMLYIILAPVMVGLAYIPPDVQMVVEFAGILGVVKFILWFIAPLILFVLSLLLERKGDTSEAPKDFM